MAKAMKKGSNAGRVLRRVRKDLKNKGGGGSGMSKRNATIVLAQGALSAPKRNFGTKKPGSRSPSSLMKCLDARIPRTLGLPRAVGPYTVMRTTKLHRSNSEFVLFSPFRDNALDKWFNWCGVESVQGADPVTGPANTRAITMPMEGLAAACEVVPAALTVQVMNPASLQNAQGIFAMTRVNQQLPLGSTPATSPIVFCQRKLDGVQEELEFMVTIEWRVRFDPGNPATATHTHHDTLADEAWNGLIKAACAAGHGVEELSEDVAAAGEAL